ncbi:MAE_28990/MAE_18760 family HEPN-like nuclease [Sneathiella sp.]|uniref:MAE_28990/MAE_18760 family HEPN-like nuclease n=1 Tax=Sneathiella sp. TaxID=1964365 RepID=UPI00261DF6D1|nr:MAE_28990/MAE_18760 family HEPN-like nuclease [Sneathiella sp.]MDF2367861.1 MAE_28990/MAE_18760 family HEPN-like nuclease [Sneathiella sp.]
MAKFTVVYSDFLARLDEVEILRKKAEYLEKNAHIEIKFKNEINALCRGSVVLLLSHVEAYIKELGEHALEIFYKKKLNRDKFAPQFFYHISKDIVDEIKNTSDHKGLSIKLLNFVETDGEFWKQGVCLPKQIPVERFNKGFSNPSFKKIKAYLGRFGYSSYQGDLKSILKRDSEITINMIDQLVNMRNKIAHGDSNETSTPEEIKIIIEFVRRFCRATDVAFSNWCKNELCSIR